MSDYCAYRGHPNKPGGGCYVCNQTVPPDQPKPREFWLAKPDLDFDLNWKQIHAAEYPHKDTLVDCIHVIEKSAYDAVVKERDAYAQAMAVALREGIFAEKGRVKAAIERILNGSK